MKISQLSKAVLVSMFVAAPALASPIALCGDSAKAEKTETTDKAKKSEDSDATVKTEKKNDKKESKDDKSATKDSA